MLAGRGIRLERFGALVLRRRRPLERGVGGTTGSSIPAFRGHHPRFGVHSVPEHASPLTYQSKHGARAASLRVEQISSQGGGNHLPQGIQCQQISASFLGPLVRTPRHLPQLDIVEQAKTLVAALRAGDRQLRGATIIHRLGASRS